MNKRIGKIVEEEYASSGFALLEHLLYKAVSATSQGSAEVSP